MSNPLADYLSALEARDAREKAHEEYVNAYTKLADRTAALTKQAPPAAEQPTPSPTSSALPIRPPLTPRGKSSAAPSSTPSPSSLLQLRAELASTQKTRSSLELAVSSQAAELSSLKAASASHKARIAALEKAKEQLDRRVRDRADELKGKGRFVEEVQDEMVALSLQLHMAEQEKEKLKEENEELTRRWVRKMEEEARKMNEVHGWEDGRRKGKK
ncbi:autophagy protein 16 [Massariosphaeria phaeospora]|uniref:Autophagy protein 16 n=1 Tax=Massariosphaeria phaeospora TaxID=100035 RepID=A0A7C8M558_9PLEO|nr:autophagy protein 16 [Massariosphaeria phaeospora]